MRKHRCDVAAGATTNVFGVSRGRLQGRYRQVEAGAPAFVVNAAQRHPRGPIYADYVRATTCAAALASLLIVPACATSTGPQRTNTEVLLAPPFGTNVVVDAVALEGKITRAGKCLGIDGSLIAWPQGTSILGLEPLQVAIPGLGTLGIGARISGGGVEFDPTKPPSGINVPTDCLPRFIGLHLRFRSLRVVTRVLDRRRRRDAFAPRHRPGLGTMLPPYLPGPIKAVSASRLNAEPARIPTMRSATAA